MDVTRFNRRCCKLEQKVKQQQTNYSNLLLTYKNYLAQLTGYEIELTELEGRN